MLISQMANKNILLIEPGYKNKYPALGLMKIAQYHGQNGKQDNVYFIKGEDRRALMKAWDRIYVTTLFSFEFPKISQTIDFALYVANGHADKVFVGGIAASLMHNRFINEPKWRGIRFIKGLLGQPPAIALELDEYAEELYSDDTHGTPIEDLIPDYDILKQIDYKYPVSDAYFAYASRGCIRKCSFCGVPKLEGEQRDTAPLTYLVEGVDRMYGPKKDLTLMDNNVVASPRFKEIIAEIRGLGFVPGAKLSRDGKPPVQRRVDFNQGVDARILCKDEMYLRELSTVCLKPLRIAFDHWGLRQPYTQAIRYAHQFGLHDLSNYMLYNFHDTPADLYQRMRLNVELNVELGIRIWSFPMRYQPTDLPSRSHIGEKWTRYQLRSLQIILQATHGVVSGAPEFFLRAFGNTEAQFHDLLLWPHKFIFNRDHYEKGLGRPELDEFMAKFQQLSEMDKAELLWLLSSTGPKDFKDLPRRTKGKLREVLTFYVPLAKAQELAIWELRKKRPVDETVNVPDDERVEDAGLNENLLEFPAPNEAQLAIGRT
jgi:hypothetical protein